VKRETLTRAGITDSTMLKSRRPRFTENPFPIWFWINDCWTQEASGQGAARSDGIAGAAL